LRGAMPSSSDRSICSALRISPVIDGPNEHAVNPRPSPRQAAFRRWLGGTVSTKRSAASHFLPTL
jgi:hypothetical protein